MVSVGKLLFHVMKVAINFKLGKNLRSEISGIMAASKRDPRHMTCRTHHRRNVIILQRARLL